MWRSFLEWVASKLSFVIIRRPDGPPYLERYFIRRGHDAGSIYLHKFVGSDPGEALHDHPASWGIGLILAGGYFEERYDGRWQWVGGEYVLRRTTRWVGPGRINIIRGADFHRVILPHGTECWTLFLRTPRIKLWGFKDQHGKFELSDESRERLNAQEGGR